MKTGEFRRLGSGQGLAGEVVNGLLADEHGRLWISTNRGLACFDPQTETFGDARPFSSSFGEYHGPAVSIRRK